MTSAKQDDLRRAQEAATWVIRLESEGSPCHAAFLQWAERSSKNFTEFLAVAKLSWRFNGIDPHHEIDVSELIPLAEEQISPLAVETAELAPRSHAPNIRSLGKSMPSARRRWSAAGAALLVFMAVLFGWASWPTRGAQTYSTAVGEQRSIKLIDGSLIHLNTNSAVKVRYTDEERNVSLLSGEALFSVESDISRPFRVWSGLALVQAVGTQFDIYQRAARTTISVIAGEVKVLLSQGKEAPADAGKRQADLSTAVPDGTLLGTGEQVSVGPDGQIHKVEKPDISKVTDWLERRLTFEETSLAVVADEFNRYNTVQITVEGQALRVRPVSGIFSADHPEVLLLYLQKEDPRISVERTATTITLRLR